MATRTSRQRIDKGIGDLKDDVAQLAQQLAGMADTATGEALDTMRAQMPRRQTTLDDVLEEAGEKGREAAGAAKDIAETFADNIEDSMRRRPLTTLAIALGVGFVVGTALRR